MKKLLSFNQIVALTLLFFYFFVGQNAFAQGEATINAALENSRGSIAAEPLFNPLDTGNAYGEGIEVNWFTGGEVYSVLKQPDGKIIYFGKFIGFNGTPVQGAVRLKAGDLTDPIDTSFHASFTGGYPTKAVLHPYGILVTGTFTHINGIPRAGLAILAANGFPWPGFEAGTGADGPINDMKVLPDFSICLAGNFRHFNGMPATYLYRLASSGTLSGGSSILPETVVLGAGQSVNTVTFGPGILSGIDYYYIGGKFSSFGGIAGVNGIARINNISSAIDPGFQLSALAGTSNQVSQIELVDGGSNLLVSGSFSASGISDILKVSASTATPDAVFQPAPASTLTSATVKQFVVDGSSVYSAWNSGGKGYIYKLNLTDGLISAGFTSGLSCNGLINCMIYDNSSSDLVLGGKFTKINGEVCNKAGKLNTITSESSPLTNSTGADAQVYTSLYAKNSSKNYIGGAFCRYNNAQAYGIARITDEGLTDGTFNSGTGFKNGCVLALALDSTIPGAIIAAGSFTSYNGISKNGIVRILSNGNIDPGFNPGGAGTTDSILCIAVQPDGKILVGGTFTTFNSLVRNRIVRLNSDGSVDPSFVSGSGEFNGRVRSILIDGSRIYVGGDFTNYNGNPRNGLVCLGNTGVFSIADNFGTGISSGGQITKLLKMKSNGKIYAAGRFQSFNALSKHRNVVRLMPNGSADPTYIADTVFLGNEIFDIEEDNSGRGGLLVSAKLAGDKAGGPTRGVIKLKPKGSKDLTFNTINTNGPVFTIKRDPLTGKLIFVGNFNLLDSIGKTRVTRLLEEATRLTIWTGAGGWDWDAPDCGFSALIANNYTNAGFTCRKLFVASGVAMQPSSQVDVCQDAFSYSSNITGTIYLMKDTIDPDTVKLVEGYFFNLSLDNDSGATIIQPTLLYGSLKLWSGALKTNNQLTFKSTAARTARLAKVENAAGLNGQITLERFVGGGVASWHFLGTPIKKQAQSHWSDDFLILPSFMHKHNEASNSQNGWVQTSDSMKIGKGFRVFLNQPFFNSQATFRNTGAPYIGNFNFTVAYTPGGYGGGGWNLLANPYPCEIDWHDFNRTNIGSQIHYWIGNQYGSYNSVTQIGVNGAGRYVPSSQAFFVKASSASPALSVTEDSKPVTPQNPGFYRTAVNGIEDEVARIKLISEDGEQDETAIRWMQEAQPIFENEFDNHKLENPGITFFSLSSDGIRSSIQGRNFPAGDSVHFGYSVTESGNFFLELKMGSQLMEGISWKLRDNESGFSYPVSENMLFPFFIEEGASANPMRFTLIGKMEALGQIGSLQKSNIAIYPNPGKDRFRLLGLSGEFTYQLEDAGGRLLKIGKSSGEVNLQGQAPGIYFLRLTDRETVKDRLKIIILP